MGVRIGKAQWSYTGFNAFRARLAREEGLDLHLMHGFGGDMPWDETVTPLRPLLDHSDCDGDLSPEECAQIAPRLTEICQSWENVEFGDDPQLYYDRSNGLLLAEEMRRAVTAGERLEFR